MARPQFTTSHKEEYPWMEKSKEDRASDARRAQVPPVLDQTFASFAHEALMRDVNLKMSGHNYHHELDMRNRSK